MSAINITDRNSKVVTLRGLGRSVSAIAEELDISTATVNRILKKHPASKGGLIDVFVDNIKAEVAAELLSDAKLKFLAAATVRNNLIMKQHLDSQVIQALALIPSDPAKALLQARALNSLANTMKLSNDSVRSAIKIAPASDYIAESELPTLVIQTITEEEVQQMRREQEEDPWG